MRLSNTFLTYSRYSHLFPVSLCIGILIGLFIPTAFVGNIISFTAIFLLRVILYFTIPYFFFALIITIHDMLSMGQFRTFFKTIISLSLILHASILFLSMGIFIFFPLQNLIPLVNKIEPIIPLSLSNIVADLFPSNWLSVFTQDNNSVIPKVAPLLLLATFLGIIIKYTLPRKHIILETIQGLRNICINIIHFILPWLIIATLILSIYRIKMLPDLNLLTTFSSLIIVLVFNIFFLSLLVFPILLKYFNIPIPLFSWWRQIMPPASIAFAGGDMTVAGAPLLHTGLSYNSQRKTIDAALSFSFVFSRIGISITIALTYMLIYKSFSADSITILQFLIIFFLSILSSFAAGVFSTNIIISSLALISSIQSISVQELYIIIIPIIPLLSGMAASIDTICASFIQIFVKHHVIKKHDIGAEYSQHDDSL